VNNLGLKISILLTGVLLTAVHYKLKPSPTDKEIREQSVGMSGGVDWRNRTAPDFEITTTRGERFRLSDSVGKKVVVLNFFATWCGPCRAEMPELSRYFDQHKSDTFFLLGIDAEEKGDRVDAFLDELKVTFPAGVDEGAIQKQYGVEVFPTTVVIGVDGKVQLYETGALVNAEVAFDSLLSKNRQLIKSGQTISPEAYRLVAQNQTSLPLRQPEQNTETKKQESPLDERGKRIAARMGCPCGCDDKVQACSCNTSKKIKKALAEESFTDKSDDEIIRALNKRFCSGAM
jgi:cytochrome c biogenesis protein CcmG/thiol:disulfide interchange protein DsbE